MTKNITCKNILRMIAVVAFFFSIVFPINAQSNCNPQTITSGQTIQGALDSSCTLTNGSRSGSYVDIYMFDGQAGQQATIQMSANFDTFLFLNKDNSIVASDDDGGDGTNSLIQITLPSTGRYTIQATEFTAATPGNYAISLSLSGGGGGNGGSSNTSYFVRANQSLINELRSISNQGNQINDVIFVPTRSDEFIILFGNGGFRSSVRSPLSEDIRDIINQNLTIVSISFSSDGNQYVIRTARRSEAQVNNTIKNKEEKIFSGKMNNPKIINQERLPETSDPNGELVELYQASELLKAPTTQANDK